eukprot:239953-Pleurochrysis_carterae.AAC.3
MDLSNERRSCRASMRSRRPPEPIRAASHKLYETAKAASASVDKVSPVATQMHSTNGVITTKL